MLFLTKRSDGGKESPVTGYFLIEIKGLFTIALLHFAPGCRENYHNHAFNAFTWFLSGKVKEDRLFLHSNNSNNPNNFKTRQVKEWGASLYPKYTPRSNLHKVSSDTGCWALTFRGPWTRTWNEYNEDKNVLITLSHGRKVKYTTPLN